MRMVFGTVIALTVLTCTTEVGAFQTNRPDQACFRASADNRSYSYCVHQVEGSINPDVVYYFHGAYGSAQDWTNSVYYQRIYEAWGAQAPTVISVSYGSLWLLAEKNSSARSGLFNHFVETALPAIEKARQLQPARRLLAGASMGGFNAVQLYLKKPELFSKVLLLCPALAKLTPYSSTAAVNEYINRTRASRSAIWNFLYLGQLYFPNEEAYKAADPFVLVQSHVGEFSPSLLVTIGLQDEYGFFEGSADFSDQAELTGANAAYVPLEGKHCSWDWSSATQFILDP